MYSLYIYIYMYLYILVYALHFSVYTIYIYIYVSKISMISVEESHQHFSNLELGETLII